MSDITNAYNLLCAQAQALCDSFPYKADRLTAYVTLTLHNGIPYVAISAHFEAMSSTRRAELEQAGCVAPGLLVATMLQHDEASALAALAAALDVPNPFAAPVMASEEQVRNIIRLLNDPRIEKREKNVGLLNLDRYTAETANEVITGLKQDINARAGHIIFPEVAEYAVVAEAFTVGACGCASDGCGLCDGGFVLKELAA